MSSAPDFLSAADKFSDPVLIRLCRQCSHWVAKVSSGGFLFFWPFCFWCLVFFFLKSNFGSEGRERGSSSVARVLSLLPLSPWYACMMHTRANVVHGVNVGKYRRGIVHVEPSSVFQVPFKHDSLLVDRKESKLTKAEKREAKKGALSVSFLELLEYKRQTYSEYCLIKKNQHSSNYLTSGVLSVESKLMTCWFDGQAKDFIWVISDLVSFYQPRGETCSKPQTVRQELKYWAVGFPLWMVTL